MRKLILSLVFVLATGTMMNANTNVEEKRVYEIEKVGDCFDRVYEIINSEEYENLSDEGVQWLSYWLCGW
jgi:hypothetical protein